MSYILLFSATKSEKKRSFNIGKMGGGVVVRLIELLLKRERHRETQTPASADMHRQRHINSHNY